VRCKDYKASRYLVFSAPLLPHPSKTQIPIYDNENLFFTDLSTFGDESENERMVRNNTIILEWKKSI